LIIFWFVALLLLLVPVSLAQGTGAAEEAFKQAALSLSKGDLAGAERGFSAVLKQYPRHVGAMANLGTVYSRMGRLQDSARMYVQALQVAPNEPGLLLNLGLLHLRRQDYTRAKPLLAAADQSRISSPQTKELLAACQIHTGEADKGLSALAGLPPSANVLYLRGLGYLKLKKPEKAHAEFRELLTTATTPAQAQFLLGKAYLESGILDDAAAAFGKALQADPKMSAARLDLAKTYIAQRNNGGAEAELRTLVKVTPHDPEPAYYLSALLVMENRGEVALPVLQKLAGVLPDSWSTQYYLGRAYYQTRNYAGAVAQFEKAAQLNAGEGAVWYQLARAYQAAGREADAQRARDEVVKLKQQSVEDEHRLITRPPQ
jgi:Flp pilus assembly protein TadD